jgi:acyl-homoserine lactone synthase
MKMHIVRTPADQPNTDFLERNYRLPHTAFVDLQAWEAMRRPDASDIDAFDTADATHLLLTDGDEPVGGSRLTPLDQPSLLQTVFPGLVQEDLPAPPSHGADRTRFYARIDRREGRRRALESAALFCAMTEYTPIAGHSCIAMVPGTHVLGHGTSLGRRTRTPLAEMVRRRPASIDSPLLH